MDAKNFIQASARVVTITELQVGDVYSRIEPAENSYSESQLKTGVVMQVMNNGEMSVFTAIEHSKERYGSGYSTEQKLFKSGDNLQLFSCPKEMFVDHITNLIRSQEQAVEKAERDLEAERRRLTQLYPLTELQLNTAVFKEVDEIEALKEASNAATE